MPLISYESKMDLGQVRPGSQKSRAFWLTNRSGTPVEVAEITSSCDCLKIGLPGRILVPEQKVEARIDLDLRKEPQFTGNLDISVTGRGKKGEMVFAMKVRVSVDGD